VTKLWASRWENNCRESCSAGNLFGERVALQVVARRVVLYVKPHNANALEESLLREYLLVSGRVVAERVSPGRVARSESRSASSLGESLRDSLLGDVLGT
jgi:hypothetical protein